MVYYCERCPEIMEFEDENEFILVCPNCGYTTDTDHYGLTDEEYEELYLTREEVTGEYEDYYDEDNPWGETYDEVYNELDPD